MDDKEICDRALDSIVKSLEAGIKPWEADWQQWLPQNFLTPIKYISINTLILWAAAREKSYRRYFWLTPDQVRENGWDICDGEEPTQCVSVSYSILWKECGLEHDEVAEIVDALGASFYSPFPLYNVEQIRGLSDEQAAEEEVRRMLGGSRPWGRTMEEIVGALRRYHFITVLVGGARAEFVPSYDWIQMPLENHYSCVGNYCVSLLHEMVHWTGNKDRLDRKFFSENPLEYGYEELIAEIASAFCCADLGLIGTLEHHECYIDEWLALARKEKQVIQGALRFANHAQDYLLQPGPASKCRAAMMAALSKNRPAGDGRPRS